MEQGALNQSAWVQLKKVTEAKFQSAVIDTNDTWGFQIQPNTTWEKGLTSLEIQQLESLFGFSFPADYVQMLQVMNGFDLPHVSINPDNGIIERYERRCYTYPEDYAHTQWLLDMVNENLDVVNAVLSEVGYNSKLIEGFIPLYGHRILVSFTDKSCSPVLSIWGDDVIVNGDNLLAYWYYEFDLVLEQR